MAADWVAYHTDSFFNVLTFLAAEACGQISFAGCAAFIALFTNPIWVNSEVQLRALVAPTVGRAAFGAVLLARRAKAEIVLEVPGILAALAEWEICV